MIFTTLDLIALAWFVAAWTGYAAHVEYMPKKKQSLNQLMNQYRLMWMQRMLNREVRIVDTQVMATLVSGTAFFASTSLLAIGGALTVLRSPDEMLDVLATLPFGAPTTRLAWEIKAVGLAVIFVYAFFKFAWSYRLFNYVAILLGAMPFETEKDTPEARSACAAHRAPVGGGGPALQSWPARDLLRARLSWLVRQPLCADGRPPRRWWS